MFQAESLSFTAKVEDLSSHGIAAPVEEKYWHRSSRWVIIVILVSPHGLTRGRKGTDLGLIQVIRP